MNVELLYCKQCIFQPTQTNGSQLLTSLIDPYYGALNGGCEPPFKEINHLIINVQASALAYISSKHENSIHVTLTQCYT